MGQLCGALDVDVSVVLPLDVFVEESPVGQPRGAGVLLPGVNHPLGLTDVLAHTHDPAVPESNHCGNKKISNSYTGGMGGRSINAKTVPCQLV